MSVPYILDTNAIIYYSSGEEKAVATLDPILREGRVLVPTLVIAELWSGRGISDAEFSALQAFLDTVSMIPLTAHIARTAGELRRAYSIKLGDSIVAATTLVEGGMLVTRNHKDFARITSLPRVDF